MTQEEKYMQLALKLARRGVGFVEPNPAVGCVVVKVDQVIGKGWHKEFGGPHAEINAIEDCRGIGATLARATMYVTLEPCCHEGKTGPCCDAIIAANPAKVIIATPDPADHANGKGIERLRAAGIEVVVGLCKQDAEVLNAPFFKFVRTRRPWVTLKWAQSIDGKLAAASGSGGDRWISNELSRKDVHKLRRSVGAILVGAGTVIADDPFLTPRPSRGKHPLRIVLDSNLRIPLKSRIISTKRSPSMIVCTAGVMQTKQEKIERIRKKGVEVFISAQNEGKCDIDSLLTELGRRGIQQLLVEGGPEVITAFLKGNHADAVRVYIAPKIMGPTGTADINKAMAKSATQTQLHHANVQTFNQDACITGLIKEIKTPATPPQQ